MAIEFQKAVLGKTVFVRIIEGCLVGGKHLARGTVAEVSDEDGVILTSMRRAEYAKAPEKPKEKKPA